MTELYHVHQYIYSFIYSYYQYKQVERLILLSVVKQALFSFLYHEKTILSKRMKDYLLIQQSLQD